MSFILVPTYFIKKNVTLETDILVNFGPKVGPNQAEVRPNHIFGRLVVHYSKRVKMAALTLQEFSKLISRKI